MEQMKRIGLILLLSIPGTFLIVIQPYNPQLEWERYFKDKIQS